MNRVILFISQNLLCAAACAFTAGITLSFLSPPLLPHIVLIATAVLAIALLRYRRRTAAAAMILLFFASLGVLYGSACRTPPSDLSLIHNHLETKKEAVLLGTVASFQSSGREGSHVDIISEAAMFKGESDLSPVSGRISLTLKGLWPKDVEIGDRVLIRATLSRPFSLQTAGSFDYVQFLAEKGIFVTGNINSPLFIHKISGPSSFAQGFRSAIERARMRIGKAIDGALPPQTAGIYKAVLIGDRSEIDSDLQEKYKSSGCMHILAISGLHMSIIALFLFAIIYWLLRRSSWLILHYDVKKAALVICVPLLCLYALLAGANIPVLRSLIMSLTVIAALCFNRQRSIFATLALALFWLLVWNPSSVFSVSFQLTFAAVASIAAISPFLVRLVLPGQEDADNKSIVIRLKNWLFAAVGVSVAATVGTAPLLLFSFNRISLIGPAANLVLEPLICFWSLGFGFLACPFVFLYPALASFLLKIGGVGLFIANKSLFDGFPWANLWLPTPSPWLIVLYYVSLLVLIHADRDRKVIQRMAGGCFAAVLFFFWMPPAEIVKGFIHDSRITVIDVGQGSANLLELPGGKRVMIDCGGASSPRFNAGVQVVGPFLWRKGIRRIDAIIITHPDSDHYNGVPFILEHFHPETLWINGSAGHDRGYAELLDRAKKMRIDVKVPAGNDVLVQGGGAEVSAVENPLGANNGDREQRDSGRNDPVATNDAGLVLKFSQGQFSALFPGDITKRAEALLVSRPELLRSKILLAPHHGSSTSSSEVFLEAVHPELVIVSAGASFDRIFPAPDLAERLAAHGAKMVTTAQTGCVLIITDGSACTLASGNGISLERKISLDQ